MPLRSGHRELLCGHCWDTGLGYGRFEYHQCGASGSVDGSKDHNSFPVMLRDPGLLREAKEEFRNRTKDVRWYNLIHEDRRWPKFEPFPKEHYRGLVEAFRREPKWEGYEPELSDRMEKVGQKVLGERF